MQQDLMAYVLEHTTAESDLLKKIDRETHLHVLMPRMLSGHLQGSVLAMLSRMIQPQYILEIGTFTGYSAICLAEGLKAGGKLITIDKNEELEQRVKQYFKEANLTTQIEFLLGDAAQIIPTLSYQFDLIFIDADKKNYALYFDLVWDKLAPQGFMVIDNVLWSGKVLQDKKDEDTLAIDNFNKKIQADSRIKNVLLPLRDGLMIVQKQSL